MRYAKKKIFSFAAVVITASILSAGVYIVPQEYDNMRTSVKSSSYGVINQATSTMSNNSYTIGGQNLKYRCLKVPKIQCSAASPIISANISEASLKKPGTEQLVSTFQLDLRVEEDTTNWYICGAGYGGQFWDQSTLTSKNVGSSTQITYTYNPNANSEEYYYFTSQSNSSNSSFLSISYHQICQ